VTYIITQNCVDLLDKTCIAECPVDCIYEGERMLYIDPPRELQPFHRINVEFITCLGSPGGASTVGKISSDHPMVAALPPQPAQF